MVKRRKISASNISAAANLFFEQDALWNFDYEKEKFIDHMNFLKDHSVEESTLYRKWREVQSLNNTKDIVKTGVVKDMIWSPTDIMNKEQTINEIRNLRPVIIEVPDDHPQFDSWKYLRILTHTMEYSVGIGRSIRVFIKDETSGKVIGIVSMASDVISIGARDKWIGWTDVEKFDHGRLKNTCILSTILPTQPFGYNFLGGKLIASIMCTKSARDLWESKFGDVLVGMTTTSLYGSYSMYKRIPWWKDLGKTAGRISLKPDDDVFETWSHWIRDHHPEEYDKAMYPKAGNIYESDVRSTPNSPPLWKWSESPDLWDTRDQLVNELTKQGYSVHDSNFVYDPSARNAHPPSGPKQSILTSIYRNLGIVQSKYEHGFERGVYFAPLYENTKEFLRNEISKNELILNPRLDNDIQGVLDWWVPKAIRRYETLYDDGRIKPDHLYYRDMIQMKTWEEVKLHYLNEVGR